MLVQKVHHFRQLLLWVEPAGALPRVEGIHTKVDCVCAAKMDVSFAARQHSKRQEQTCAIVDSRVQLSPSSDRG